MTHEPTRRGLLAGFAAAPVAIIPAAAAPAAPAIAAGPDATLIELGKLLDQATAAEAQAWAEAGPEDDPPGVLAAQELIAAITDQIEVIPATTLAGLHVKMRAFQWCRSGRPITTDEVLTYASWGNPMTSERLMVSVLADLDAMGRAGT